MAAPYGQRASISSPPLLRFPFQDPLSFPLTRHEFHRTCERRREIFPGLHTKSSARVPERDDSREGKKLSNGRGHSRRVI